MKTILVATDFSNASQNALTYAVNLARPFNAKVILYHAYLLETFVPDFVALPTDVNIQEQCEKLLDLQLMELEPTDRLLVEAKCEPGIPSDMILEAAKAAHADLVLIGMKSHGLVYRKFFGSVALTVCRHSFTPVIVVPENYVYKNIVKITLASDLVVNNNPNLLEPLKEFANKFHSEVFVVSVFKEDEESTPLQTETAVGINWELHELSPVYQFIENDNTVAAIESFVKTNKVDLLAMVAHPHSLVERIFVKSSIKEIMFDGVVPLMILPDSIEKATKEEVNVAGATAA